MKHEEFIEEINFVGLCIVQSLPPSSNYNVKVIKTDMYNCF